MNTPPVLLKKEIATPLGVMIAVADAQWLYLLQFADMPKLERQFHALTHRYGASIVQGTNNILEQLAYELNSYFAGTLTTFTVPCQQYGTGFQQRTWNCLKTLAYGATASYTMLAHMIHYPAAHRAVANANGTNNLVIIVPCHRIIKHDGSCGGYGGRPERKAWLIAHEEAVVTCPLR